MIANSESSCYTREVDLAVSGSDNPTVGSARGLSICNRKEPHVANIKSQKKRIITAEKARVRNRAVRSELKTAVKAVRTAVEAKDVEAAQAAANKAGRLLDKAASKGIIHKNQAAQRKSGVQKLVNTIK